MKLMRSASLLLLVFVAAGVSFIPSVANAEQKKTAKGKSPVIEEGRTVTYHYTLTVDGAVIDSSTGKPPIEFKAGSGKMLPAFEKEVSGMRAGQKKTFRIAPQDAYGPVIPAAIQEVSTSLIPSQPAPAKGMIIRAMPREGEWVQGRIVEVKQETVVIDFNHPLAGKTLVYQVEIVTVK